MKPDEKFMSRALELANRGKGRTHPNPLVGCVVIKGKKIVGEGWHEKFGGAHAEVNALKRCGNRARNSTLFVTLEPCAHYGKTSPCTRAIIAAGVKRVVAAMQDPNPLVEGKGFRELRRAGIKVRVGVLRKEAERLNESYIKWITREIPFVALKAAVSADFKIAGQKGKWITNAESRRRVHELRNEYDAILAGVGTILKDDPRLTCRISCGRNPLRVILDSRLRIPLKARALYEKGKTIIATTSKRDKAKEKKLKKIPGVELLVVKEKNGEADLRDLLRALGKRGVASVLVEGGQKIFSSFVSEKLANKIFLFIAPCAIGKNGLPLFDDRVGQLRLRNVRLQKLGSDALLEGYF